MRDTSTYEKIITIESDDVVTLRLMRDDLLREQREYNSKLGHLPYTLHRSSPFESSIAALERILNQVNL